MAKSYPRLGEEPVEVQWPVEPHVAGSIPVAETWACGAEWYCTVLIMRDVVVQFHPGPLPGWGSSLSFGLVMAETRVLNPAPGAEGR